MIIAVYIIVGLVILVLFGYLGFKGFYLLQSMRNMKMLGPEVSTLTEDGFTFRDLNKNGKLDPYEDSRLPVEERVEDLLSQMTLEEKAGMMFISIIGMNKDGSLAESYSVFSPEITSEMIIRRKMNHFNILQGIDPTEMATWYNRIQKLAERTRLGIPVTIATDPRHAFSNNPGASMMSGEFSQWPEPIGLAAIDDPQVLKSFADIARREYLAVGIRLAIHPMADLATEPRWCRVNGTFGEDAELTSRLTAAYISGFQGEEIGTHSVLCMTKHFPGGGPQKDGEDAHFTYGKEQVYPGDNFDYHLIPFEAAFEAGTAQIMPYYGLPRGLDIEEVGFGFNKDVITGLLRGKYGFEGVVCTDWGLLTDKKVLFLTWIDAKRWGVEELSVKECIKKAIDAGVDQFGGENIPMILVEMVKEGLVSEERLDISVRRLLRDKFRLGLFDDPYVDPEAAAIVVGNPDFVIAGEEAQRKSLILLENRETAKGKFLPLSREGKIYIEGIDPVIANNYAKVVKNVEDADIAILRLNAPYEPRKGFASFFHAGDLDFNREDKERICNIVNKVPTVVDIYLDRPAVIPEIAAKAAGLIANFGAKDAVLLDLLFGKTSPTGKLPFEMPSSMNAVRNQKEDVPYDSENPLYPFGYGLHYENGDSE